MRIQQGDIIFRAPGTVAIEFASAGRNKLKFRACQERIDGRLVWVARDHFHRHGVWCFLHEGAVDPCWTHMVVVNFGFGGKSVVVNAESCNSQELWKLLDAVSRVKIRKQPAQQRFAISNGSNQPLRPPFKIPPSFAHKFTRDGYGVSGRQNSLTVRFAP